MNKGKSPVQILGANPLKAWSVLCQPLPTMQSQGPTLGREDRVRATKGFPDVRGGGAGQVPSLPQPAIPRPEGRASLCWLGGPARSGRWSLLALRFHIPESSAAGQEPQVAQAKGSSPEDCSAHTPRGSSPVHSTTSPATGPSHSTRQPGGQQGPSHPSFVFGPRLQKEPMTPLV